MAGTPLLDRVTLGDHVCWVADRDIAACADVIAGFLHAGLAERHKVIYSGADPDAVLGALAARGVHTARAERDGQLRACTAGSSYLASGVFDAEAVMRLWRAESAQARAEGYLGMRVVGDMNWAARPIAGGERLGWYESQVNELFADGYIAGVCLYDRRLFDPLDLRGFTWSHPGAVVAGTPFDPSVALRIRRVDEPYGLRLSGEADRSNRNALMPVVRQMSQALADDRAVTVDVAGLRFADTAVARILVQAAASGPGRLRLTGCSPMLARLLGFHGAAGIPTLTVEQSPI